ncbi:TonB-dependent receptor [Prolixibacteraceae bacterium JC049]|nr:TonB-dependent receptor [Prolixibacteraceae bacterium JC049]
MKQFLLLLIIPVLLCFKTVSAGNGDVVVLGHVVSDGEHIPFVNIVVVGTTIGTATDETGHYILTNLPEGKLTIRAQAIGYKSQEKNIEIKEGETKEVNFELQPDMIMTEGVVVSASRSEVNRRDAAVVVNVLNPKLMEATQSMVLSEGLNFQPGLRLENNCQNCGYSQLRMNGLEGAYTQILINSRPVFSALNGVYGLDQIPANMIERVEVIRGGGSVLFGSNAIAGTVNIITKDPVTNSYEVSSNWGLIDGSKSDRVLSFNSSLVNDDRNAGIFLFGMHRSRDPWDANGDDFTEVTKLRSSGLGFSAFYRPTFYSRLSLEFNNMTEFRRGGNKFDQLPHHTEITEQVDHKIVGGGITYDLFSPDYSKKFSAYITAQSVDGDRYYGAEYDTTAYGKTKDLTAVFGVQYVQQLDHFLFTKSELTLGAEDQYSELEDLKLGFVNEVVTDQNFHNFGVFAQNEWKWDQFSFLLGARIDKHEFIDNAILNPRMNLLYKATPAMSFRASYASGYRAPQVFDDDLHINIAGAQSIRTRLADDLKEEKSNSYTFSIDYTKDEGSLQYYWLIEGFYTKLNNPFISTLTENNGAAYYLKSNGSGAKVQGVNLELKIAPSKDFQIQGGLTLQKGEHEEAEQWSDDPKAAPTKKMLRSPNRYGYLVLNWDISKKLAFSATSNYTGSMYTPHVAGGINPQGQEITTDELVKTPDFLEAGFKLSYDFKLNPKFKMQVSGGVQNLFNSFQDDFDRGVGRDAKYIYGPIRPRTIFFGLKFGNIL